ncbi:Ubiquinone biosynthesis O-methyltransferase [uncultured archaeon]|nr:Ubiquinone biosynthesis O-methyltransferase [uncultured archaeon]
MKVIALHGSEYSDSSGNAETQEQNWIVLHPDQHTSASYDVTLDTVGTYLLQVKTLAGSQETLLFGGSIYFDKKYVGDIKVHRSNGTNNMLDTEFIIEVKTKGRHNVTISNEVGGEKTRLHLRIMGISIYFDMLRSVARNPEMYVMDDKRGTFETHTMGISRISDKKSTRTKKVLALHGSEYSDSSGNIETQERNWVVLPPDPCTYVSYDFTLDMVGLCQLHVITLAGLQETLLFGGSIYFDNKFVGDIGTHRSNGTNKIQDSEFLIEVTTKGRHNITISNEVRGKNSSEALCRLHLRIMELWMDLEIGIKAVIDNPEMFRVTEDFVETLDKYLSGLKAIGNGRLYEKNFMAHIMIDHFKIHTDYINKFKTISGSTVLELGCGSGGSLLQLESYGATVVGIEIDPSLIKLTNSRLKTSKTAYCVQADGFCLPFPDAAFDICVCSHVLEHVADPHKLVREINRILKIGGVALIEFPNRLYPVEPHGNLFLMSYLPLNVAKLCATIFGSKWLVSGEYRSRLHVMHLLKGEYSYFSIKKIIRNLPLIICDVNPVDRLVLEMPMVKKYPPKLKRLLSLLVSRNITIIVKKEKAVQHKNLLSLKPYFENKGRIIKNV